MQARHGWVGFGVLWTGEAGQVVAGTVWWVLAGRGIACSGVVGQARYVSVRCVSVSQGRHGPVGRGQLGQVVAGKVRPGLLSSGYASCGKSRQGRHIYRGACSGLVRWRVVRQAR